MDKPSSTELKITCGGLANGPAALIYSLYFVSSNIKSDNLIAYASSIINSSASTLLRSDVELDLLTGLPGYVLSLSRMEAFQSFDETKAILIQGVQKLLNFISPILKSKKSFMNTMTGMAHGIAGLVLALSAAQKILVEDDILKAIKCLINLENSFIKNGMETWPDLRYKELVYTNAWCNGSTGIGLSRIEFLKINNDELTSYLDICRAVKQVLMHPYTSIDQPCCGNLGRVELLLLSSHYLNDKEISNFAQEMGTYILNHAINRGYFLNGLGNPITYPFLFQGLSGIAYQLMRLAFPTKTKSFLLFE